MSILTDAEIAGILEFPCSVERLANGNTLIADAGAEGGRGSEILEVSPAGQVVWRSDHGYRFAHAGRRLGNGNTIVADTTNDRIVEVDPRDRIVFSSEMWGGGTGRMSDGSLLAYPNNIAPLPRDEFLVTNRNGNDFLIVDRAGNVRSRVRGVCKHPHNAEPLPGGGFLVADSDANRVVQLDAAGREVWSYATELLWPRDANRLANGNTLIADSKHSRVLEVSADGRIVWQFALDYFANIYEAARLDNGNTLIADQQHHRVIEVAPDGSLAWEFHNFRKDAPVFDRLTNGFFKKRDAAGRPADWTLMTRFSEGGGRFLWAANAYGREVPCLEYDRPGALCLQQAVKVTPGEAHAAGLAIATEGLDGSACLQVAFKDACDGLLCDVTAAPRGTMMTGDTPWTQDAFDVVVPEGAVAADVRVFINGKGRVLFDDVRFMPAV